MYRIIESKNNGKVLYTVQKNRKWIIPWKWHNCKLEVFYGCGSIVYTATFASKKDAEQYIEHKGSMANGLIQGCYFYTK